jgi:mannose-6-phosphate isomerase-like protein (cupin superfamily)
MGEITKRPWGYYEVLVTASGYQVKRLTVQPGQRLSLQWHHHREEHWTVVKGVASVTLDNCHFEVAAGGTVDVPVKAVHRLANAQSSGELVVVEVQVGDYLGEDDIVRVEDDFGRAVA